MVPSSKIDNLHDDQWHHGAFVRSEDTLSVYVDGRQDNSIGGVRSLDVSSTTDFNVGRELNNYYPGLIVACDRTRDEVALFNVALTESDIVNIMDHGLEEATGIAAVSPADKLATTWGQLKSR